MVPLSEQASVQISLSSKRDPMNETKQHNGCLHTATLIPQQLQFFPFFKRLVTCGSYSITVSMIENVKI